MDTTLPTDDTTRDIAIGLIDASATNPRKTFDEVALRELGASMASPVGQIHPALVRPRGERFELVAGEKAARPTRPQDARRAGARAKTVSNRRASVRELRFQASITTPLDIPEHRRPTNRRECAPGGGGMHAARPCPFASCAMHLAVEVSEASGNMKRTYPDVEIWEMRETCALDVADRGGATLLTVGRLLNITRERVRQVEEVAFARMRGLAEMRDVEALATEEPEASALGRGGDW